MRNRESGEGGKGSQKVQDEDIEGGDGAKQGGDGNIHGIGRIQGAAMDLPAIYVLVCAQTTSRPLELSHQISI